MSGVTPRAMLDILDLLGPDKDVVNFSFISYVGFALTIRNCKL